MIDKTNFDNNKTILIQKSICKDLKEIFKKDYVFFIIIFLFAIIFHLILWKAFPLHFGPDGIIFADYFIDIFNKESVFPMILTYRMPVSPLLYGFLLKTGGVILTSTICQTLSLICIPFIYLLANSWGKIAARISAILLVILVPFQILFHQINSDALFGFAAIIMFVFFKYLIDNKNIKYASFFGISTAFLVLIRPSGVFAIILMIFLFFIKIKFKLILKLIAIYAISFLIIISPFLTYKIIKFNDFSLSRGSNYMEFMRIYTLQEPLFKPANGPYSGKLGKLAEEHLINSKFYKKYDVSFEKFLNHRPNRRFFGDLIVLVDKTQGWNTNYKLLRQVAFESIKSNPLSFFKNLSLDIFKLAIMEQALQESLHSEEIDNYRTTNLLKDESIYLEPDEGELIPFSKTWWMLSSPDNKLPTMQELEEFDTKLIPLIQDLARSESNPRSYWLVKRFWNLIKLPFWIFWAFAIISVILSKKNQKLLAIAVISFYIVTIIGTLYSQPLYLRYRLPLDPLFILVGVSGFLSLFNNKKLIY